MNNRIFTVGHSNRSLDEFISLLRENSVRILVDIRTIPNSKHNPQFGQKKLMLSLESVGISYAHLPLLGGLRRPAANSPNTGWKNESFRGFADYMQTEEFRKGVAELMLMIERGLAAIMCAEAVPWRCHRFLVADALKARSVEVFHIISRRSVKEHKFTSFARIEGDSITYPPAAGSLFEGLAETI